MTIIPSAFRFHRKGLAPALALTLLALLAGCAAHSRVQTNTAAGVDPVLAAKLQAALDASGKNAVGVQAAILIPGQGEWRGVTGYADPVTKEPVTQEQVFELGSLTKIFTSSFILQLSQGCGKNPAALCLDDKVVKYVPIYKGSNVDNNQTLRQTLNMTSGVAEFTSTGRYLMEQAMDYAAFWDGQYILSYLIGKPDFAAGSSYAYSNTNYIVAGAVLQGQLRNYNVAPYYRERFFDRYRLSETFFGGYEIIDEPVVDSWVDFNGDGKVDNVSDIPTRSTFTSAWTAGAFLSDADDMAHWIDALFHRKIVLAPDLLREMLQFVDTPVNPPNEWWDGYGLGVMRQHVKTPSGDEELYGYGGNTNTFTSYAFYLPSKGCSISFLINEGGANQQRLDISAALVNVLVDN